MNKIKLVFFLLFIPSFLFAQDNKKQHLSQMKAKKIAYITEQLNLSVVEAQAFWPVYNEMENKKEELFKQNKELFKELKTKPEMTDKQKLELIKKVHINEMEKSKLQLEYFEKFKAVITVNQLIALHKAERNFKQHLLEDLKKRNSHQRNNNR